MGYIVKEVLKMAKMDKNLGTLLEAIELEKFGYDYYSKIRTKLDDLTGQKLITYLAKMEVIHIKNLEEEYIRHLKSIDELEKDMIPRFSLIDIENIFQNDEEFIDVLNNYDPIKVTMLAIKIEKRSKKFYEKKLSVSNDDYIKVLFQKLADYENDHIMLLEKNLERLQTKHEWQTPPVSFLY